MKKYIITLLTLLIIIMPSFAKKKEKPILVLSSSDVTASNDIEALARENSVFKINEKIYFLIYTKDGFKSDFIRYQIVKQDDKVENGGYTRIRNITRRIQNRNYYSDYFVISQKGKYCIQVFDITNLHQWIAFGAFLVTDD